MGKARAPLGHVYHYPTGPEFTYMGPRITTRAYVDKARTPPAHFYHCRADPEFRHMG